LETIHKRKHVRQTLGYPGSFQSDTILLALPVSEGYQAEWEYYIRSKAFLKSIKSWCGDSFYSYFFSSIWWMQNTRSVVDLLRRRPRWWFSLHM